MPSCDVRTFTDPDEFAAAIQGSGGGPFHCRPWDFCGWDYTH